METRRNVGLLLCTCCFIASASDAMRFFNDERYNQEMLCQNDSSYRDFLADNLPCGITKYSGRELTNRVIGGQNAKPGQFPFQVYLHLGLASCGGIMIDEQHILTAAHCVDRGIKASRITAIIGEHSLRTEDGQIKMIMSDYLRHENYGRTGIEDIALLRMEKSIKLKLTEKGYGSVNRICLPVKGAKYKPNERFIITGWGRTNAHTKKMSDILQVAEIGHTDMRRCQHEYRLVFGSPLVDAAKHICAYGSPQASCNGDSGGPLMRLVGNKYELVGIVSFGTEHCSKTSSVYTRVATFIDWIKAARDKLERRSKS